MPPYVDEYAFTEVPANMVVKVFSGSVDLYKNAQIWSRYTIMTIDEDSTALTVMLPDDGTDGRYRNASLQAQQPLHRSVAEAAHQQARAQNSSSATLSPI